MLLQVFWPDAMLRKEFDEIRFYQGGNPYKLRVWNFANHLSLSRPMMVLNFKFTALVDPWLTDGSKCVFYRPVWKVPKTQV